MDFYDILDQVIDLLKQRERASYRALKIQFKLDDESIEAIKEELVEVHQLATDYDGKMLVWSGETDVTQEPATKPNPTPQPEPQLVIGVCVATARKAGKFGEMALDVLKLYV